MSGTSFREQLSTKCRTAVLSQVKALRSKVSSGDLDDIIQYSLVSFLENEGGIARGKELAYLNRVVATKIANHFRERDANPDDLSSLDDTDRASGGADRNEPVSQVELGKAVELVDAQILREYPTGWKPKEVMDVYRRTGSRAETANALGKSLGYVDGNLNRYRAFARTASLLPKTGIVALGSAPRQTVNDILVNYRQVMQTVGFRATVDAMKSGNNTLLRSYRMGRTPVEVVVANECALAKLLQQCGCYGEATARLLVIEELGKCDSLRRHVDWIILESVESVSMRLRHRTFGTDGCAIDLERGAAEVMRNENKARFVWRLAVDALARRSPGGVPDILRRYRDLTADALIPSANINMINAFRALATNRHDEVLEQTNHYLGKQLDVWENHALIADPSIQGVLSGLMLDCSARLFSPIRTTDSRDDLVEFMLDFRQFQVSVGIGDQADGLREIATLLDAIIPKWQSTLVSSRQRKRRPKKGTRRDLIDLLKRYRGLST